MFKYSIAIDQNNQEHFGIRNLELCDGYFGAPLAEMTPAHMETARASLIKSMDRVVLYTADMRVAQYDNYVKFFRNAHLLGIENVKLSAAAIADAADDAICAVVKIAEAFSIKVVFELESANIAQFGFERYAAIRSDATGLIFNPNEFVKMGKGAFLGCLYKAKFKDDIVFLRACDMLMDSCQPVLPEKGNSEVKECASNLLVRSFRGYFSFSKYGETISVPEVIETFTNALCNM